MSNSSAIHFQTFEIAGPATCTTTDVATGATRRIGGRIGDCLTDTFSITSPGNPGTPVICGFNTGQHSKMPFCKYELYMLEEFFIISVIVDASELCNVAAFDIGSAGATRQWDIKGNLN